MLVRAFDLGKSGYEPADGFRIDRTFLERLETLRVTAGAWASPTRPVQRSPKHISEPCFTAYGVRAIPAGMRTVERHTSIVRRTEFFKRIGSSADAVFPCVRLSWKGFGRTVRRIGLMAGAVALMLQVFAWTLTMPTQITAMDGMAVCTAEGLVHLDMDGAPVGTDAPTKHPGMEHCPLCPLIGGLHLPPPLQTVLRQTVARHSPESLPGAVVVAGWFLSTLQARAPPV